MANSFLENFLGGFSQGLGKEMQQERDQNEWKSQKDYEYAQRVHLLDEEETKKEQLQTHKSLIDRQDAQRDADANAAALAAQRKSLFGEIKGVIKSQPSSTNTQSNPSTMNSQVAGAMGQSQPSTNQTDTAASVYGQTSAPPQSQQGIATGFANGQGTTSTGALPGTEGNVSGQPAQAATPQPSQGAAQTNVASMQPMAQPISTSTSPQPVNQQMQGHSSPEAAPVQNPNMNNSSTDASQNAKVSTELPKAPTPGVNDMNVGGNQYGYSPIDWVAKDPHSAVIARTKSQMSSLGIDATNPDNVAYYMTAPTPESVLNKAEQNMYLTLYNAGKETQLKTLMDNSPNVRAWRLGHGLTTDGEPMPDAANPNPNALLWDKTINRPYGNLKDLNTYYTKEQDKINDKNSQVYKDITDVREQSQARLENLNQQDRINNFTVNAPAPETKDFIAKLTADTGLEDKTAAFDAWAQHILGVEKRDIFSNTKGRVTNQEAQQFFKALPDLVQSREGREAIISYMKGQASRELEVSNLKSQYLNDNNGLYNSNHASQLEQAYRAANPIFGQGNYDVHNPVTMFNSTAMSSSNWLNSQMGKPINPVDSLQQNLGLANITNATQQKQNVNDKVLNSIGSKYGF
jgi:hypothetical protein